MGNCFTESWEQRSEIPEIKSQEYIIKPIENDSVLDSIERIDSKPIVVLNDEEVFKTCEEQEEDTPVIKIDTKIEI